MEGDLIRKTVIKGPAEHHICCEPYLYDQKHDEYICPNNKRLRFYQYQYHEDRQGYRTAEKVYLPRETDCGGCLLAAYCAKSRKRAVMPGWQGIEAVV